VRDSFFLLRQRAIASTRIWYHSSLSIYLRERSQPLLDRVDWHLTPRSPRSVGGFSPSHAVFEVDKNFVVSVRECQKRKKWRNIVASLILHLENVSANLYFFQVLGNISHLSIWKDADIFKIPNFVGLAAAFELMPQVFICFLANDLGSTNLFRESDFTLKPKPLQVLCRDLPVLLINCILTSVEFVNFQEVEATILVL